MKHVVRRQCKILQVILEVPSPLSGKFRAHLYFYYEIDRQQLSLPLWSSPARDPVLHKGTIYRDIPGIHDFSYRHTSVGALREI